MSGVDYSGVARRVHDVHNGRLVANDYVPGYWERLSDEDAALTAHYWWLSFSFVWVWIAWQMLIGVEVTGHEVEA